MQLLEYGEGGATRRGAGRPPGAAARRASRRSPGDESAGHGEAHREGDGGKADGCGQRDVQGLGGRLSSGAAQAASAEAAARAARTPATARAAAQLGLERGADGGDGVRAREPQRDAEGAADQAVDDGLADHLPGDPARAPAERLERAELAHPAGDGGGGEQTGDQEGGHEDDDRQPLADAGGERGGSGQGAGDGVGEVGGGGDRRARDVLLDRGLDAVDPLRVGRLDVDRGDFVLRVAQRLGLLQRHVEAGRRITAVRRGDADDLELRVLDGDRAAGLEFLLLGVGRVGDGDPGVGLRLLEGASAGDGGRGQRAEGGLGDVGAVDGVAVDVEVGAAALDAALRGLASARAAALTRAARGAAGGVLRELTARELAADLDDLEAQTAHRVGDTALSGDLADGGTRQRLEALHHDAVGALLLLGAVVLRVEAEARPFGGACGGRLRGLGDRHVRAQPVQGLQDLVLGPAHAGGDRVDDDDQRDAQGQSGGDDEGRLRRRRSSRLR